MADVLGFNIPLPDINITGLLSDTWIYILIISIIGIILIIGVFLLLFYKTYNKKVIVFENISGQGYQPIIKTRARTVKLSLGGEEVFKTLAGGKYVTAYGRKMGKNTYWFAKGPDGYWYNIVVGDLDTKMAMLDIDPVDRDVRMFHVGLQKYNHQTYDKKGFMEKYGIHILMFVFLVVLILGMWFIIGQVGNATSALAQTADTNKEVVQALNSVLGKTQNIQSGSGIVPAS